MSFAAGDKVTWADPLPGEPAWKQEQRKRWEAEFGPPPYTVMHTSPFRPEEDLVYTKEFYETSRSYKLIYFGSPFTAPPGTKFGKWVKHRSPKGLVQSWFTLWKSPVKRGDKNHEGDGHDRHRSKAGRRQRSS